MAKELDAYDHLALTAVNFVIGGDIEVDTPYTKPTEAAAFQAGVEFMVKRNEQRRKELFDEV